MSSVILDSSAVLALVLGEPGGERVKALLVEQQAHTAISTINWCEVLTRLQRHSPIVSAATLPAMLPGVEVVPFTQSEAQNTAELAKTCGSLSLGDRACLALASSRHATAWTTDRIWGRVKIGIDLEILR
jgi:PIN domain nuclease of toxin-antitoxin system